MALEQGGTGFGGGLRGPAQALRFQHRPQHRRGGDVEAFDVAGRLQGLERLELAIGLHGGHRAQGQGRRTAVEQAAAIGQDRVAVAFREDLAGHPRDPLVAGPGEAGERRIHAARALARKQARGGRSKRDARAPQAIKRRRGAVAPAAKGIEEIGDRLAHGKSSRRSDSGANRAAVGR